MSWCCRLTEMKLRRPKNLYRSRKWLWYTVVWNYTESKRSKTSAPHGAVECTPTVQRKIGVGRPGRRRRRVPARVPCGGDGSCGLSSLETCQQHERKITVWRNQGFKLPGQSFPVHRRWCNRTEQSAIFGAPRPGSCSYFSCKGSL